MALRKVENADFVGKTVESIENSAVNVLTLRFTDGSIVDLWTEVAVGTEYGDVYGIFVDSKKKKKSKKLCPANVKKTPSRTCQSTS